MPDISPHDIDAAERISRYLLIKNHFNPRTGHVSPQAFKPTSPKNEGDVRKTSIYRTKELAEAEVWTLGDDYVTKLHSGHLSVLARADTQAQKILELDLKIDPDGVPHPRHANIVSWPDGQEVRQMNAVSLARSAQLVPR
jgi:hypothetical protein